VLRTIKMKCDEYREAIAADPSGSFDGGDEHAAACPSCCRFRDEMRALDGRIAAALAIDVPPLRTAEFPPADATAPANVVDLHAGRKDKSRLPAWIGIAAVLAVAAFLGARLLVPEVATPSLAEQIVAHMDYEQESRRITSVAVPEQTLQQVMGDDVSTMDTGRELVTYAMSCVINGRTVPHLVIQGTSGPVTLILMAEETIDDAIPLSGENVHGVIVPVGNGSVAIIGEREEQLREIDEIGERIVESVSWKT
jgi:hypothetical protein